MLARSQLPMIPNAEEVVDLVSKKYPEGELEGEKIKGDRKEAADKNNMVFLFSLFYFQEHFSELETSLHNNTLRKFHCESMIWFVQPEWRLSELL